MKRKGRKEEYKENKENEILESWEAELVSRMEDRNRQADRKRHTEV